MAFKEHYPPDRCRNRSGWAVISAPSSGSPRWPCKRRLEWNFPWNPSSMSQH